MSAVQRPGLTVWSPFSRDITAVDIAVDLGTANDVLATSFAATRTVAVNERQ